MDTLYKSIFFGGLYGITFFLVYLSGRKVAPRQAIYFAVGSWVLLMGIMLIVSGTVSGLLFIPVVLSSLVVFRNKADNTVQQFFTANRIYKAATVPEQVSNLLGTLYYSCAEGTLTTQFGEDVRYNWWQGMTSSMVSTGKAYVTTFSYYLAISFGPGVVSEEFKRIAHAKTDTSGFTFRKKFKRFFVLDTETPIRVVEAPDGSFVIVWQTFHDVERFTYYLNWLTTNRLTNQKLESEAKVADVKPVEQTVTNIVSAPRQPEVATPPTLPSSRYQHEQALGQTPKVYTRSYR